LKWVATLGNLSPIEVIADPIMSNVQYNLFILRLQYKTQAYTH